MHEKVINSHLPARLRKKIEWVSLMLRLSSRTNVLPSAAAQCNMAANERSKRTLLPKILKLVWVILPVCFLDDETDLDRLVCLSAASDAILPPKSTSALADDQTLTRRDPANHRKERVTLTMSLPIGWHLYYKTDNHGSVQSVRHEIHIWTIIKSQPNIFFIYIYIY